MATGPEWSCPICSEASGDIAYVGSCLHKFCRGCILRWARKNASCPLCRQVVHTIIYPAPPDQAFVEMAVPQPFMPHSAVLREQLGAVGPQPQPQPQLQLQLQLQPRVAAFPAEMWALFFRNCAEILRPLELWLNEVLCGACWWDVAIAQDRIVASLCRYGLNEAALVRELQPFLQEQTAAFVRQLTEVAADQCGELALRCIEPAPRPAEGPQGIPAPSPAAAASPSTSGALEEPGPAPAEPAGAEAAGPGQGSGCAAGPSGQPGRRGAGGVRGGSIACKKACRRQN